MIQCEASGVILVELPATYGTTKSGKDWEKIDFIMETSEKYHSKLRFSMISFDGPIDDAPKVGDSIKLRFTVEAREYNGNWYNDVKAYSIQKTK